MQEHLLSLVPVYKTEIATALNMTYDTFGRRIKHLNIPPTKVVPKDIIRICDCCNMGVERVINHIEKYNLRK